MNKKKIISVVLLSLVMLISLVCGIINITDISKTQKQPNTKTTIDTTVNIDITTERSEENITLPDDLFVDSEENIAITETEEETAEFFESDSAEVSTEIIENAKFDKDFLQQDNTESLTEESLSAADKKLTETKTDSKKIVNIIGFVFIFVIASTVLVIECTGNNAIALSEGTANVVSIGKINNIGKRAYQQDSVGADVYDDGVFGIVADGMGGLSGGDEISSSIVINMLQNVQQSASMSFDETLVNLTAKAVNEINRKLGTAGFYKSGSTLVAVYVKKGRFHWMSIGDSRIYLYRNGALMQINREHTYENELLHNALNNEITFNNAKHDPQIHKLTSFIGMGKIKHSDLSTRSMKLVKGDKLLLMSDGVFGTLSEDEIATIVRENHDCKVAAAAIETAVNNKQKAGQDNFTALIIGF